jgi:hypothetical protein
MSTETWKPIPEWEGVYEASSLGRIRSIGRTVQRGGHDMRVAEKILKLNEHQSGYVRVVLSHAGRRLDDQLHSIIARTFHGPRPEGLEVRHVSGIQSDNSAANLKYGTSSENALDTVAHGNNVQRNRTHCPFGHALAAPNLVAAESKRGHRKCRACNSARSKVHRLPHLAPEIKDVADAYYAEYAALVAAWRPTRDRTRKEINGQAIRADQSEHLG